MLDSPPEGHSGILVLYMGTLRFDVWCLGGRPAATSACSKENEQPTAARSASNKSTKQYLNGANLLRKATLSSDQ